MKPTLREEEFNILIDAGLIWFDPKMSENNKYGFNIPKIIELINELSLKTSLLEARTVPAKPFEE